MLVWAVASQKGGVGKTTTVATLAGWLQQEHLRVLVIDTDPHASLTSYLGFDESGADYNLFDLYATETITRELFLKCTVKSRHQGLDLIPAAMTLATIDRQLSGRQGVGRILDQALHLVEDCYDVVLIDCPPVLGALMVNALAASTLILVPTQTEFLALKGLQGMVRTFEIMSQADPNADFDYIIVPTMFDKRTRASNHSLTYMREHYPSKVWSGCIPIDTLFRESSAQRTPLPLMAPSARGAQSYYALLRDLVAHELKVHPRQVSPALAAVLTDDLAAGGEMLQHHGPEMVAQSVQSMITPASEEQN